MGGGGEGENIIMGSGLISARVKERIMCVCLIRERVGEGGGEEEDEEVGKGYVCEGKWRTEKRRVCRWMWRRRTRKNTKKKLRRGEERIFFIYMMLRRE